MKNKNPDDLESQNNGNNNECPEFVETITIDKDKNQKENTIKEEKSDNSEH